MVEKEAFRLILLQRYSTTFYKKKTQPAKKLKPDGNNRQDEFPDYILVYSFLHLQSRVQNLGYFFGAERLWSDFFFSFFFEIFSSFL